MNQPERILVVEDDEGILEILDITLADLGGYQVDRCASGAEALAHATAHPLQPRALLARLAEFWEMRPPELVVDVDPERIRAVQRHYLSTLPVRLRHINALWTTGTRAALALIQQQAHQMGGSGATLGFARLSEAARQLETALAALGDIDPIDGLPAAGVARAQSALEHLREAIRTSMAAPPA